MRSHLLTGTVWHHRVHPVDYSFRHAVFYLALDLDEIEAVAGRLALLSYNRTNLLSLRDADHFDGGAIATEARRHLGENGAAGGRVTVITYPRVLGYIFNPISLYLNHAQHGLTTVLAEVHNTHQERHVYRLENEAAAGAPWRSSAAKQFYVSPFLAPAGSYAFSIRESAQRLEVQITEQEEGRPVLYTGLRLRRHRLTDRALAAALLKLPLVPLKTTALIHLHALNLWRRRVPFHHHTAAAPE